MRTLFASLLLPFTILTSSPRIAWAQSAAATPGGPATPAGAPAQPAPAEQEQGRTANNAIFIELLGNGGIYSLNYERFIRDFGVRAGFSYLSIEASAGGTSAKVSFLTVPVVGSYYLGGENHKLQLGAGLVVVYLSGEASNDRYTTSGASGLGVAATGVVGYRYMPRTGGFNFGVGFTPLVGAGGFLPWGGLSLGAVF